MEKPSRWAGIIYFIVGLLLLPGAFAFAVQAVQFLWCCVDPVTVQWVIAGFAVYFGLFLMAAMARALGSIGFLETLEHETIHALATKILLERVYAILVTAGPGVTSTSPGNAVVNPFIDMAPYCVPLLTLLLLPVYAFMPPQYLPIIEFLLGFTLAFHLVGLAREFRIIQKDLQVTGFPLALTFVLFFNSVILVVVVSLVMGDPEQIGLYFQHSLDQARYFYETILDALRTLLACC